MDEFELSFEWAKVLFSLEYHLVQEDIRDETDVGKRILKQRWLEDWRTAIHRFLQNLVNKTGDSEANIQIFTNFTELQQEIERLLAKLDDSTRTVPKVVLLEVCLFTIYHPLGVDEDEQYKHLELCDRFRKRILQVLRNYAEILGVGTHCVRWFKDSDEEFKNELQDKTNSPLGLIIGGLVGAVAIAITAAFALPLVVAALAPLLAPGLSGAAAVSAVLAALGGGAIAAGGFGMAGGVAVIVGGGAILGASAGTGIGALFAQSPEAVIPQAAKFLVVFRNIVLSRQDIPTEQIAEHARSLLQRLKETIRSYEDELDELNSVGETTYERIQGLEKVISYLRKALKIAQRLLAQFLQDHGLT